MRLTETHKCRQQHCDRIQSTRVTIASRVFYNNLRGVGWDLQLEKKKKCYYKNNNYSSTQLLILLRIMIKLWFRALVDTHNTRASWLFKLRSRFSSIERRATSQQIANRRVWFCETVDVPKQKYRKIARLRTCFLSNNYNNPVKAFDIRNFFFISTPKKCYC